jgi:hypothetical protein
LSDAHSANVLRLTEPRAGADRDIFAEPTDSEPQINDMNTDRNRIVPRRSSVVEPHR